MLHFPARVGLGALLLVSAVAKLGDPLLFAYALRAFKMGVSDETLVRLAFIVPWTEGLAGLSLVVGVRSKGGALVAVGLMAAFVGAIVSLLWRGLDVDCPCFGQLKLFCSGPMGACHIVRNLAFAVLGGVVYFGRGDRFEFDSVVLRRRSPAASVLSQKSFNRK